MPRRSPRRAQPHAAAARIASRARGPPPRSRQAPPASNPSRCLAAARRRGSRWGSASASASAWLGERRRSAPQRRQASAGRPACRSPPEPASPVAWREGPCRAAGSAWVTDAAPQSQSATARRSPARAAPAAARPSSVPAQGSRRCRPPAPDTGTTQADPNAITAATMPADPLRQPFMMVTYRLDTIAALAVSSDTTGSSTALAPIAPCSIVTVAAL